MTAEKSRNFFFNFTHPFIFDYNMKKNYCNNLFFLNFFMQKSNLALIFCIERGRKRTRRLKNVRNLNILDK